MRKMDITNVYCHIFDYGVPLEDIFPTDDIHPRLKLLFAKAYISVKRTDWDICEVLCYGQGSLQERLYLKEKLKSDPLHRVVSQEFPPGAYFWVIRQFLGLLPIPLLPRYSNGVILNWPKLNKICSSYFENNKNGEMLKDSVIRTLSKLSSSNIAMLNLLICLIRKISKRNGVFSKRSLRCLTKYFCAAISNRAFLPGHAGHEKLLPLFHLLIVQWNNIYKRAQTSNLTNGFDQEQYTSENFEAFSRFLLDIYGEQCSWIFNLPKFIPCVITKFNKKESASQTSEYETVSKVTLLSKSSQTETNSQVNSTEYHKICYLGDSNMYDTIEDKNECDNKHELSKIEELDEEESITFYKTALNFTNTSDSETKADGFIYDDYETFRKEEFNQISNTKRKHSVTDRISKFGWSYTSPKKSPRKQMSSTPKQEQSSYIKFPDVFQEENGASTDKQLEKIWSQPKGCKKLAFKSKKTLDLIRRLIPRSSKSINSMDSNIKYKRINRSNTL